MDNQLQLRKEYTIKVIYVKQLFVYSFYDHLNTLFIYHNEVLF